MADGNPPAPLDPPLLPVDFSAGEIVRVYLLSIVDPTIVPNVLWGALSEDQQTEGGVSILDAGLASVDRYAPVAGIKLRLRCMAPSLAQADQMSGYVTRLLHQRNRTVLSQPSTGVSWLVHLFNITGKANTTYIAPYLWDSSLFLEIRVGTQPV